MDTVIARAQYWNNTGLQLRASGHTTSEQFIHSHTVMKQQNSEYADSSRMMTLLYIVICECLQLYVHN